MSSLPSSGGSLRAPSATSVARARYLADVNCSSVFSKSVETYRRQLKSPERFQAQPLEMASTATPSDRAFSPSPVSPPSEDFGSCRSNRSKPIQPSAFEPRWDLCAMTPRWNRVVELSSTRAMGSSVLPHHNHTRTDLEDCAAAASAHGAAKEAASRTSSQPRVQRQTSAPGISAPVREVRPSSAGRLGQSPRSQPSARPSSTGRLSQFRGSTATQSLLAQVRSPRGQRQMSPQGALGFQRQMSPQGTDCSVTMEGPMPCPKQMAVKRESSAPAGSETRRRLFSSDVSQADHACREKATSRGCSTATSSTRSGGGGFGRDIQSAETSLASAADFDEQEQPLASCSAWEAIAETTAAPSRESPRPWGWSAPEIKESPRLSQSPRQDSPHPPEVIVATARTVRKSKSPSVRRTSSTQRESSAAAGMPVQPQRQSSEPAGPRHSSPRACSGDLHSTGPARSPSKAVLQPPSQRAAAAMRSLGEADQLRRFGAGSMPRQDWDLDQDGPRATSSVARSPVQAWASQVQKGNNDVTPLQLSAKKVREQMLRSTALTDAGVYDRAEREQKWKISQLKLSKLPDMADEKALTRICQAFGHQVVTVDTLWDPLKDRPSGGKANVVLRSSAETSQNTEELVSFLQGQVGCKASSNVALAWPPKKAQVR